MSKKKTPEKKEETLASPLAGHSRWLGLLQSGDFRTARSEAAATLADPSSGAEGKAAAQELLSRTSLDLPTAAVGLGGLLFVLSIAAGLLL